jgi:hypothetical protein
VETHVAADSESRADAAAAVGGSSFEDVHLAEGTQTESQYRATLVRPQCRAC